MRGIIRQIEKKGFHFELVSKGLGWLEISILNEDVEKVYTINVAPCEHLEKSIQRLYESLS